jgi:hypothetical protein
MGRIGGDFAEGVCRGAEEYIVDLLSVLQGDGGDLMRHREYDVEVLSVQQFGLTIF